MTATTVPQDLAARSWNGLLRIVAVVALFVVLVAGSFAIGRGTADETVTIVREAPSVPAVAAIAPGTCERAAHTAPPC